MRGERWRRTTESGVQLPTRRTGGSRALPPVFVAAAFLLFDAIHQSRYDSVTSSKSLEPLCTCSFAVSRSGSTQVDRRLSGECPRQYSHRTAGFVLVWPLLCRQSDILSGYSASFGRHSLRTGAVRRLQLYRSDPVAAQPDVAAAYGADPLLGDRLVIRARRARFWGTVEQHVLVAGACRTVLDRRGTAITSICAHHAADLPAAPPWTRDVNRADRRRNRGADRNADCGLGA